jgi:hypothetical protein
MHLTENIGLVILDENMEYLTLSRYDNGSVSLLFCADYSGGAPFKYLCCFSEETNGETEYSQGVAGNDYFDILSIFQQRIQAELHSLLDLFASEEAAARHE